MGGYGCERLMVNSSAWYLNGIYHKQRDTMEARPYYKQFKPPLPGASPREMRHNRTFFLAWQAGVWILANASGHETADLVKKGGWQQPPKVALWTWAKTKSHKTELVEIQCYSPCPDHASGPNCDCQKGFEGRPQWDNFNKEWKDNCLLVACPEGADGAPACKPKRGYRLASRWRKREYKFALPWDPKNQTWGGSCDLVACRRHASGTPDCTCDDGYVGWVKWDPTAESDGGGIWYVDPLANAGVAACSRVQCPHNSHFIQGMCHCNNSLALNNIMWKTKQTPNGTVGRWVGQCDDPNYRPPRHRSESAFSLRASAASLVRHVQNGDTTGVVIALVAGLLVVLLGMYCLFCGEPREKRPAVYHPAQNTKTVIEAWDPQGPSPARGWAAGRVPPGSPVAPGALVPQGHRDGPDQPPGGCAAGRWGRAERLAPE